MAYKEDVGIQVEHKLCWVLQYLDNTLEDMDEYIVNNRLTIKEQKEVEKTIKAIYMLKHKIEVARAAALVADLNVWLG